MQLPAAPLPHTVIVHPYTGTGPYGDAFVAPVTVRAFVEDRRRLVLTASGKEVISETTVYTGPDLPVLIGSTVTVWAGTARSEPPACSPPVATTTPRPGPTWRSRLPNSMPERFGPQDRGARRTGSVDS